MIAEYGSLDGVYEALPTAKHTPAKRAKLEGGKESAYLSQKLAEICRTAPIGVDLQELQCGEIDRAEAKRLFLRLEFSAFLKRFGLDASDDGEQTISESEITVSTLDEKELKEKLAETTVVGVELADGETFLSIDTKILRTEMPFDRLAHCLSDKVLVCYDAKNIFKQLIIKYVKFYF